MLVVGFDTATPAIGVALHDGARVVSSALTVDARRQGELLAPLMAKVMADVGADRGDLTAVVVGVGPGPYTGLRVGLITARVLGSVLDIPVYGVCTLDVIAADASAKVGPQGFLVATDARRKEVYWARYDATGRRVAGPEVGPAGEIEDAQALPVAGDGARLYPEAFGELVPDTTYPDARTLCEIVARRLGDSGNGNDNDNGRGPDLLPPEPLYLRRPDAREPGAPKRVTPP